MKVLGAVTAAVTEPATTGWFQPAPLLPDPYWFSDEAADAAPEQLTVFPDGSVAGLVAPAGRCLLDGSGECWTVPRPADGRGSTFAGHQGEEYAIANRAKGAGNAGIKGTVCADGSIAATGVLSGGGGHARRGISTDAANSHYADTSTQRARVRYVWSDKAGNGVGGVVAMGALWPEVSERQVLEICASATSVDYRWIIDEAQYRFVGTCLVNIGALPHRYASLVDAGGATFTDQWEPEPDVPAEFLAALEFDPPGTLDAMTARQVPARICTSCPPADRTAAASDGPGWFAEVAFPGGSGAFVERLAAAGDTGLGAYVVHPVVDGMIDQDARTFVPAEQAQVTGRKFETPEAVLAAMGDGEDGAELPGDDMAQVLERMAAVESTVAEVKASVDELRQLLVDDALAGMVQQ